MIKVIYVYHKSYQSCFPYFNVELKFGFEDGGRGQDPEAKTEGPCLVIRARLF